MKLSGQVRQSSGLRQWGPVLPSTKKKAEVLNNLSRQAPESRIAQKVNAGSTENYLGLAGDTEEPRRLSSIAVPDKCNLDLNRQRTSVERVNIVSSGRASALRERVNRLQETRGHCSLNPKELLCGVQGISVGVVPLKKVSPVLGSSSATKSGLPQRFLQDSNLQLFGSKHKQTGLKNSPNPKASSRLIQTEGCETLSPFESVYGEVKPITPRRLFEEVPQQPSERMRRSRNSSRSNLVKTQQRGDETLSIGDLRTCGLSMQAAKILSTIPRALVAETGEDNESSRLSDDSDCIMTAEEEKTYGKRFMPGYEKLKLLGKGGQALVWLGRNCQTGELAAIKQVVIGGFVNEKTARKELELSELIFDSKDTEYLMKLGKLSLVSIKDHVCTKSDLFMAMDIGGSSLSKWIYSMKGVFVKSERIYKVPKLLTQITHNRLYCDMRRNFGLFKKLTAQLLVGLHVLQERGIVHCDMKPENILVKYNPSEQNTEDVKIIDFGASFMFDGQPFLTVTTPEYLPPEFLQLFSQKKAMNNKQKHDWLKKHTQPWSIDVWGLGVILMECLVGVPVWMSFKCQTNIDGKEQIRMGLFSSPARDNDKIADKMIKFVPGIKKKLRDMIGEIAHIDLITDLLEKMLQLDPNARQSPSKLLSHALFETSA